MLYLTCTIITSVDLAHYGISRAKDWVSVDCGTSVSVLLLNARTALKSLLRTSERNNTD